MSDETLGLVLEESKTKHRKYVYLALKRVTDIILSIVGLLLVWPLFIVIGILIKIETPGPIMLKQTRIGKNGKPFKLYKFRSMIDNAEAILDEMMKNDPAIYEEYTTNKKLKNDPRVTKVGKFIRKTSIDELPQLINIFLGEMTLVGPRPYLPREQIDMGGYYHFITKMTPGLTGLWQVSGRNDCGFNERLKLDTKYYQIRGIKKDLSILLKTVSVVLNKKGAK